MISLYIHIPFCKAKCKYCAFYSVRSERGSYLSALESYIEHYGNKIKKPLSTLYIGGGTPSLLTPSELTSLLQKVHKSFDTSALSEATIECNPESITADFLKTAKALGINRLSIGIQSFDDKELSAIGRLHNSAQARGAIELARECGFENISCDLIFGLPHQTEKSLEKSLETLAEYDVSHISCYNLQVEEGTPLYNERISVPSEEIQEKMYYLVCSFLADKGYDHYEVSNFAKCGLYALHNSKYWDGSDYLGLGVAAHSKIGDMRFSFDADIEKFIGNKTFEFDESERITDPLFEKIMLSLRTSQGLDASLLKSSDGYIKMLCENGFARRENGFLKLTDRGFYLSNTIISDITAKEC
ncbi:MAG: radical SAM family heme chaperone HemW [Clostridia bacterium]|nr:radical SAM family heme chaperone HemW [Clostridia bacterium]